MPAIRDMILAANLTDGEKSDDRGDSSDSNIADSHDNSDTDASKGGKRLESPQHWNPKSEYTAEIDE